MTVAGCRRCLPIRASSGTTLGRSVGEYSSARAVGLRDARGMKWVVASAPLTGDLIEREAQRVIAESWPSRACRPPDGRHAGALADCSLRRQRSGTSMLLPEA